MDQSEVLYNALKKRGFHEDLCKEIAYKQMNTDYTRTRMLGYIYRMTELNEEQLVDEMISILEDRRRLVHKYESEEAQAALNQIYNEGL